MEKKSEIDVLINEGDGQQQQRGDEQRGLALFLRSLALFVRDPCGDGAPITWAYI